MITDTAISTRYVCATDAEEALAYDEQGQSRKTLEAARAEVIAPEVDFEIIVIARRMAATKGDSR